MVLRVMLIDENTGRSALLERALLDAGHEVAAKIAADEDLLGRVKEIQPDVIIIDIESPDRDTLEHMHSISREQPKPIVMFAEKGDSETIGDAIRAGVSAYVVDGLSSNRVKPILEVAIARFREFQALRDELDKARSSLAERKVIEKAKGIIMKQRGYTEQEAYGALRKLAMDRNQRMADVARNVVEISELLG
jgi:response regulator NasT